METPYSQAAWTRLGELLRARRVEFDSRYRNKALFCRERAINYKVVGDIEGARRTNFSPEMLRAVEVAYGLARGSILAALAEGPAESLQTELAVVEAPAEDGVLLVPVPLDLSEAERNQVQEWAMRLAEDLARMRRGEATNDPPGGARGGSR